MTTLIGVLAPALAMPLLMALFGGTRLPCLFGPERWPAEFWVMAVAGTAATAAGVLDWRFHRGGGRVVPSAERRAEAAALLTGALVFALLAFASCRADPRPLLVPVIAVALATATLIAFDEARFHRRCGRRETLLHRLLVGGNGVAFLAWCHWCFGAEARLG